MDIFSLLIFFIYVLILLIILIYISPMLSAFLMMLLPAASIFVLPDQAMGFFSIKQFSFAVPVYNIHILLLIWSAFIGIIAYTEILSWYLLRETKPKEQKKPTTLPEPSKEPIAGNKTWDSLRKFIRIMSGKK